jgi:exportin-1
MEDYVKSNPNSRDPETLMLFAIIIKKDSNFFNIDSLKVVLDSLIQSTLAMIKDDFTSFPEFREGFFKLVHNIITYCTEAFLNLDSQNFQTVLQSIIFGFKHEMPEVMEIGLKSLWDLNDKFMSVPSICQPFYVEFYSNLLNEVIQVLTDCKHLSGFKLQCKIFQQLIQVIESNTINQPLNQFDNTPHTYPSNKEYVIDLIVNCIMNIFPNLNNVQVKMLSL